MTAAQFEARYLTSTGATPLTKRTRFAVAGAVNDLRMRLTEGHAIAAAMSIVSARPQNLDALNKASTEIGQDTCRADFLAITGA